MANIREKAPALYTGEDVARALSRARGGVVNNTGDHQTAHQEISDARAPRTSKNAATPTGYVKGSQPTPSLKPPIISVEYAHLVVFCPDGLRPADALQADLAVLSHSSPTVDNELRRYHEQWVRCLKTDPAFSPLVRIGMMAPVRTLGSIILNGLIKGGAFLVECDPFNLE